MPDPTPGAKMTLLPREMIARVTGAVKNALGNPVRQADSNGALILAPRREPWFGPGRPIEPMAPAADVAGRRLDYQYGININVTLPRESYTGISFEQLRHLSKYDLVRLAIETRKDQMSNITGSFLPKKRQTDELRAKPDDRCQALMDFMDRPDQRWDFQTWLRMLVDEQLSIDAVSLYIRRDLTGKPVAIEQVMGDHIVPKLDIWGREPLPDDIAYQQVLKGMPAINYTSRDLLYCPRNPGVNRMFGFSPVEQIILTVNTAIRRGIQQLAHFTDGNLPDAIAALPEKWTADQVREFQTVWDAILRNQSSRDGKVRFVPGPMQFQPTRSEATLFGQFDEWLARVVCYAFSLPNINFVQQVNRATAETQAETALQEGLGPMMVWAKSVLDRIVRVGFGYEDLEWVWDDVNDIDEAQESQQDLEDMRLGLVSGDEIRAKRGLPPIGMTHMIWGVGPMGIIAVSDLNKAFSQGLGIPQPPPQPGMMPGQPGADPGSIPGQPGAIPMLPPANQNGPDNSGLSPDAESALAGVPPELLAAVGLGPQGASGRQIDVTQDHEDDSDPRSGSVPNKQVLRTLRAAQASQKARKST